MPVMRIIARTTRSGEVYDHFEPGQLAAAVRAVLDVERYSIYRENAEMFGRENTWETEREVLVSEIRRLTTDRLAALLSSREEIASVAAWCGSGASGALDEGGDAALGGSAVAVV